MSFLGKVKNDGSDRPVASTMYGTCSTTASTSAKVVTLTDFDALIEGTTIHVKFLYSNTADSPTLNVNGTGALDIYTDSVSYPGKTPATSWRANSVVSFTYDGTAWRMNDVGAPAANQMSDILNLVYPVGAIYLSTNSTNPGTLFGGTWTQIKDTFLLAAGTSHAAGSTGGAETVTLSTSNLPSHNHSVGAHAHGLNSHTHSVGAHSHGLNGHTHSIPALSGSASGGAHTHGMYAYDGVTTGDKTWGWTYQNGSSYTTGTSEGSSGVTAGSHSHSVTTIASTTGSGGGGSTSNSSAFNTGVATGNTANSSAFNTGSTGSGTAVNKMPPFLSVYCWKRVA